MPSIWYTPFLGSAMINRISAMTAPKMMLLTNAYTPNKDHDFVNDVNANEVVGAGYTAGGQAVVLTPATDLSGDLVSIQTSQVVWSAATITARYAAIYDDTAGGAAADPLVFLVDFLADITSTAPGDFTVPPLTTPFRILN